MRARKRDDPDQSETVRTGGREEQDRDGQDERDPEPAAVVGHHAGMVVAGVRVSGGLRARLCTPSWRVPMMRMVMVRAVWRVAVVMSHLSLRDLSVA